MADSSIPEVIRDVEELEELLSRPSQAAIRALGQVDGDILVLGAAGKMGPTLARMARRASDAAGVRRRVWGVSRFSSAEARRGLESHGVETIQGDLLDSEFVDSLPGRVQRDLHGRDEVRHDGQRVAHLGGKHLVAVAGLAPLRHEPDRGLFDGQRLWHGPRCLAAARGKATPCSLAANMP